MLAECYGSWSKKCVLFIGDFPAYRRHALGAEMTLLYVTWLNANHVHIHAYWLRRRATAIDISVHSSRALPKCIGNFPIGMPKVPQVEPSVALFIHRWRRGFTFWCVAFSGLWSIALNNLPLVAVLGLFPIHVAPWFYTVGILVLFNKIQVIVRN